MSMQKTLGGDRLGSGKKQKVHMHGFERSTHDLGYLWRSTMSAGTLVPFLNKVALPGDTWDINLGCVVKTHPTLGPLFGSYKVQLDVFLTPIRLYNGALHNNAINIGRKMSEIKLPQIELWALKREWSTQLPEDFDNSQINPSSLLAYIGIRGVGYNDSLVDARMREFNATAIINYYDIYKNYYANKQEEEGVIISATPTSLIETVDAIYVNVPDGGGSIALADDSGGISNIEVTSPSFQLNIQYTGTTPRPDQIYIQTVEYGVLSADELFEAWNYDTAGNITGVFRYATWGNTTLVFWRYRENTDIVSIAPKLKRFPLENIDAMRNDILAAGKPSITIDNTSSTPYVDNQNADLSNILMQTQQGLAIKTYQSDLFNNWLSTEWIDGVDGITQVTTVDTTSGGFTIDQLTLARKVYDMLNRIAVSGGTYDDWLDAVWAHDRFTRAETPMYMGGLIKELVFQEVVSNSESSSGQPLGTLAGKGIMADKHKGGTVYIKVDEPCYIMGIVSITPRIDYSQGNEWDVHLQSVDDLHKPNLDQIGFQELITEQMAWWDTYYGGSWVTRSAGKQPAWTNYMTSVNKIYGNFAIQNSEMFMTLNRRYEPGNIFDELSIGDLTTYIDPSKFNFIFAETRLDAQNFWTQIAIDATVRRKMSAKVMPNL